MSIIDWESFNENFQYYDKEIITEVIENFFEEYDDRISAMQQNIDLGDFSKLAFNAHSMKSVIGNYMAPRAYEACRKLEEAAKNSDSNSIPAYFVELKDTSRQLFVELKDYISR